MNISIQVEEKSNNTITKGLYIGTKIERSNKNILFQREMLRYFLEQNNGNIPKLIN